MLYNHITIHGAKEHKKHKFRWDCVGGY